MCGALKERLRFKMSRTRPTIERIVTLSLISLFVLRALLVTSVAAHVARRRSVAMATKDALPVWKAKKNAFIGDCNGVASSPKCLLSK